MNMLRREVAVLAVAAAALSGLAGTARAGTYTVLSCRDRAGAPLPLGDGAGGWVAGSTGGPGLDAVDRCAEPSRGFLATVSGVWPHPIGSMAWWRFVAPRGTLIEGADLQYSGYARPFDGQSQGIVHVRGAAAGIVAIDAGSGALPARWVSVHGLHDAWLQATAQCDGPVGNADCQAGTVHATMELLHSEVVLADDAPPTAGAASGSAVTSAMWQGTEAFVFAAADDGSGVYRAVLELDGAPVLARTVDDRDGRCVDATAGGRVFTRPQPCPTAADVVLTVDADALPVGEHDIALRVSDAAGNLRTVYAARKTIPAAAAPAGPESATATGSRASDDDRAAVLVARWARTAGTTLTSPYGVRNVIRGRLTEVAGQGIGNARIELLGTFGGRVLDKGGARTRADGRFTLIVPRGASSRTLLLRYRRHAADAAAAAQARLRLRVRAGVALAVAPRTSADGRAVALAGRLVGHPLPRTRRLVELQARRPGHAWATVRIVRAARDGTFTARYTPTRRGGRELRALVRAAPGYPYATGASRPVDID